MTSFLVSVQIPHVSKYVATKTAKEMTPTDVYVASMLFQFVFVFEYQIAFPTSDALHPSRSIHA